MANHVQKKIWQMAQKSLKLLKGDLTLLLGNLSDDRELEVVLLDRVCVLKIHRISVPIQHGFQVPNFFVKIEAARVLFLKRDLF